MLFDLETMTPAIVLGGRPYVQAFSETFRSPLTVTPYGPITGERQWIAHTPWYGDFGSAAFANPVGNFPFAYGPNGLTITMTETNGVWQSGLLSSVDPAGNGFSQAMGYFECRMQMPAGPGVWPAFWLRSSADPNAYGELDVVEYYGEAAGHAFSTTLHVWPKATGAQQQYWQQNVLNLPVDLTAGFHLYGIEITDTDTIVYLDRAPVFSAPTQPCWKVPMGILINLALGGGWPIDQTPNPSVLAVDYVKTFVRA